jgi:hypothetical protein
MLVVVLGPDDKLSAGDLSIDPVQAQPGAPIGLVWKGKSNDRHPGKILGPYCSRMLDMASAQKVALELHFETLEYLNSSTITAIIQVIQDARARSVKLVLVFDPTKRWQKLSFDALKVFVRDDGLIELRATEH